MDEEEIVNKLASRTCPECHKVNGASSDFCGRCGTALTETGIVKEEERSLKLYRSMKEDMKRKIREQNERMKKSREEREKKKD